MDFFAKIAEERIQDGIKRGEFDNLPGQGKPPDLEDFSSVPEHLRMAYRVLKSAGILPEEMQIRKEIAELLNQIEHCGDDDLRRRIQRQIRDKTARYNILLERNFYTPSYRRDAAITKLRL